MHQLSLSVFSRSFSAYLGSRNNLTTTTLTLGRTLDDTGQIQNLDLGTAVLQHTGNGSQSGERVGCGLTLGLGDLGKESRFTDGWEADQCDSCVARF